MGVLNYESDMPVLLHTAEHPDIHVLPALSGTRPKENFSSRNATTTQTIKMHEYYRKCTHEASNSNNDKDSLKDKRTTKITPARTAVQANQTNPANFYQFKNAANKYQTWDTATLRLAAFGNAVSAPGYSYDSVSSTAMTRTPSNMDMNGMVPSDPVYFLQNGPPAGPRPKSSSSCETALSRTFSNLSINDTDSYEVSTTSNTSSIQCHSETASFNTDFRNTPHPPKRNGDYKPVGFRDPYRYDHDLKTPGSVIAARAAYDPAKMYLPAPREPCPICVPPIHLPTTSNEHQLLAYQRKFKLFDPNDEFCKQFPGGLEGLLRRNKYSTVSWCNLLNLPRDAGCRDLWSHPRDDVLDVLISAAPQSHVNMAPMARMAAAAAAAAVTMEGGISEYDCFRGHSVMAMQKAAESSSSSAGSTNDAGHRVSRRSKKRATVGRSVIPESGSEAATTVVTRRYFLGSGCDTDVSSRSSSSSSSGAILHDKLRLSPSTTSTICISNNGSNPMSLDDERVSLYSYIPIEMLGGEDFGFTDYSDYANEADSRGDRDMESDSTAFYSV